MSDSGVRDPYGFLVLRGMGASPGVACGPLCRNRPDLEAVEVEGTILVSERATPDDIGRILASTGTLSLGGSFLSHVNTLAREFGKPSVSLIGSGAVRLLPETGRGLLELSDIGCGAVLDEGDVVLLDGDEGVVRIPGGTDPAMRRQVREVDAALGAYARAADPARLADVVESAGPSDGPVFAYLIEAALLHRLGPGGAAARRLVNRFAADPASRRGLETLLDQIKTGRVARAETRCRLAVEHVRDASLVEELDRIVSRTMHHCARARDLLGSLGGDPRVIDRLLQPVLDAAERRRETLRDELAERVVQAGRLSEGKLAGRLGGLLQLVRRARAARVDPEGTEALAGRLSELVTRERTRAGEHLIVSFADPVSRARPLIGGKAAGLLEIETVLPERSRVPAGFVVTTTAYRLHLLGETGEMLERAAAIEDGAPAISRVARAAILAGAIPDEVERAVRAAFEQLSATTVAVRSSATIEDGPAASLAGQFDTVLGLRGVDDVLHRVRWLWASLWNARALRAMDAIGCSPLTASQAVIVQEMIDTRAAGVLVTRDPVGRPDTLLVNATWGLGESISQGEVPGDLYWVRLSNGELRDSRRGTGRTRIGIDPAGTGTVEIALDETRRGPCLDAAKLRRLAELARALEDATGRAQEVEFGFAEDETLAVFQVRRSRSKVTLETVE